jgi:hypothetical protein
MLVPSLITLAIAIVALYISTKIADEIVQLTIALTGLLCLFFSLVITPWPIKLLILMTLWVCKENTNTLIVKHLRAGKGQEMACSFALAQHRSFSQDVVQQALCALRRLRQSKMTKMGMPPCGYAFQQNRATWNLPTTSTCFLVGQPCPLIPSVVCVPLSEVSRKS